MSSTDKTENLGLNIWSPNDTSKREDFNIDNQIIDDFAEEVYREFTELKSDSYPIVEATGTNTYVGSTARIKSLEKYIRCTLFVGTNATGNCSLNLNSYGAKTIKDSNGNIVTSLKSNIPYNLCYNGTDFILQGKGGGGNLIPKYLLQGYYGEGDNGRVDGAMVNRNAPTTNLNCGETYNLQEGYYSSGTITATSLASQTSGNATAAQILAGYKAWVNGVLLNGGMVNRGAVSANLNAGGSYTIPAGYHNGSGKVSVNSLASQTDGNATAAQILASYTAWVNGVKITGTATVSSLGKSFSGDTMSISAYTDDTDGKIKCKVTVGFKPRGIYVAFEHTTSDDGRNTYITVITNGNFVFGSGFAVGHSTNSTITITNTTKLSNYITLADDGFILSGLSKATLKTIDCYCIE